MNLDKVSQATLREITARETSQCKTKPRDAECRVVMPIVGTREASVPTQGQIA